METFKPFVEGEKNFIVWQVRDEDGSPLSTGKILTNYSKKMQVKDTWPYIKWSEDESVCAKIIMNGIEFYPGSTPNETPIKLEIPDVNSFEFSPVKKDGRFFVSVFVPERKVFFFFFFLPIVFFLCDDTTFCYESSLQLNHKSADFLISKGESDSFFFYFSIFQILFQLPFSIILFIFFF